MFSQTELRSPPQGQSLRFEAQNGNFGASVLFLLFIKFSFYSAVINEPNFERENKLKLQHCRSILGKALSAFPGKTAVVKLQQPLFSPKPIGHIWGKQLKILSRQVFVEVQLLYIKKYQRAKGTVHLVQVHLRLDPVKNWRSECQNKAS